MDHSNNNSSTGESPSNVIFKRKRSKRYRALALPSNVATAEAASSASSNTNEAREVIDQANCLMILAHGRHSVPIKDSPSPMSKPAEFECKTCNKSFASFQALGGHRSSHKKLKVADSETKLLDSTAKTSAFSLGFAGGRQRIHKCSMCIAEFTTGQALGGHMRRHRSSSHSGKKKKVFFIDLNVPAPADEESGDNGGASRFQLLEY